MVIKCLRLRIFSPKNKVGTTKHVYAGKGKKFTQVGVDDILQQIADGLEKKYPGEEYECVEIGDGAFNFVWRASLPGETGEPKHDLAEGTEQASIA